MFDVGFRGFFPPKNGLFLDNQSKSGCLPQLFQIWMATSNLGKKKKTHKVQLQGSIMSYSGSTVVSVDFFLPKKGTFFGTISGKVDICPNGPKWFDSGCRGILLLKRVLLGQSNQKWIFCPNCIKF